MKFSIVFALISAVLATSVNGATTTNRPVPSLPLSILSHITPSSSKRTTVSTSSTSSSASSSSTATSVSSTTSISTSTGTATSPASTASASTASGSSTSTTTTAAAPAQTSSGAAVVGFNIDAGLAIGAAAGIMAALF